MCEWKIPLLISVDVWLLVKINQSVNIVQFPYITMITACGFSQKYYGKVALLLVIVVFNFSDYNF